MGNKYSSFSDYRHRAFYSALNNVGITLRNEHAQERAAAERASKALYKDGNTTIQYRKQYKTFRKSKNIQCGGILLLPPPSIMYTTSTFVGVNIGGEIFFADDCEKYLKEGTYTLEHWFPQVLSCFLKIACFSVFKSGV